MAKKFKYRFDTILKLREHNTQQARESLNFALKIKNDKLDLIDHHFDKMKNLFNHKEKKLTAFELQTSMHNKTFIENEIKKLNDEIKELNEIISVRRIKLTDAMKEEKIMEKLKEKKILEHNYIVNREETAQFDEIAGQRNQKFSKSEGVNQ